MFRDQRIAPVSNADFRFPGLAPDRLPGRWEYLGSGVAGNIQAVDRKLSML